MDGKCYSVAGVCLGVALAAGSPDSLAQTMFKCRDGSGRTAYSNVTCEKQGLKDASAVADRTTTLSLPPVAPRNRAPAPASPPTQATAPNPPAASDEVEARKAPAQVKPVNPLIERLLK